MADVLLSPALRDTKPGPRRFRRFCVTFSARVWRMALGHAPSIEDKDLTQMGRAVVTNISLTGLFFVTEAVFERRTALWMQMQVEDKNVQLPVLICRTTSETIGQRQHHGYGVKFLRSAETAAALPFLARYILDQPELEWQG